MDTISTRTPEGEPVQCPVCGHSLAAIPSQPLLDTTCPSCGCLLMIERKDKFLTLTAIVREGTQFNIRLIRPPGESPLAPEHAPNGAASDELRPGLRLRIPRGTFEGFVAEVVSVDLSAENVVIKITIFGRDTMFTMNFSDLASES